MAIEAGDIYSIGTFGMYEGSNLDAVETPFIPGVFGYFSFTGYFDFDTIGLTSGIGTGVNLVSGRDTSVRLSSTVL